MCLNLLIIRRNGLLSEVINCDLTVVGAGYAGICAAIAAARHGLVVALVNDRDVPGGNASSEHRVSIGGAASGNSSYYAREAGIADEIKLTIMKYNPRHVEKQDYHLTDMVFYQMILNEKNILYFPGTVVYDCQCEDNQIKRAFAFKSKTQQELIFVSPFYCDASGDGILGYKAGAEYRVGREAASEFGESLAPEKADSNVMGSCILFTTKKEDQKVEFRRPGFAYDFIKDGLISFFDRPETGRELPLIGGPYNSTWWISYGGMRDTISDSDEIDFELKRLIYSYWDYIKNSGKYPETENQYIDWIAPYASKRESRRFIGDYIMTQSDIQESRDFDDAVSIGGWALDIHDVGGIYGNEMVSAFGEVSSIYNIPFSIMYSKNIKNLFLAGRIISCTHVALGSLRVMQTLGAMGQVVGTASALCKQLNCFPSFLRKNYISKLQDVLQKDGQYIIGRPEDCGLAKDAIIRTSSEKVFENINGTFVVSLENGIAQTIPNPNGFLKQMEVYVINHLDTEVELPYTIYGEDRIHNYRFGRVLNKGVLLIPSKFKGFLTVNLDVVASDKKIFFVLHSNKNVFVLCSDKSITGAPTFNEEGKRLLENGEIRTLCFRNVVGSEGMFSPENLVNGFSRPYGYPNCWISEGKQNQWIKLNFKEPQTVKQIQLYFNPQFESDQITAPILPLITSYNIYVNTIKGQIVKRIQDNYLGQNFIQLTAEGVKEIHIDILSNNGAPDFEVFAIKVF